MYFTFHVDVKLRVLYCFCSYPFFSTQTFTFYKRTDRIHLKSIKNLEHENMVKDTVASYKNVSIEIVLYSDVIIYNAMASQINGVSIVFAAVCFGADQRK